MKEFGNQFYKGTGTDADPAEWSDPRSMIAERSLAFTPRVIRGLTQRDSEKGQFINQNTRGKGVIIYERNKKI